MHWEAKSCSNLQIICFWNWLWFPFFFLQNLFYFLFVATVVTVFVLLVLIWFPSSILLQSLFTNHFQITLKKPSFQILLPMLIQKTSPLSDQMIFKSYLRRYKLNTLLILYLGAASKCPQCEQKYSLVLLKDTFVSGAC